VAPECATIAIPDHEHHVRLALFHTELLADFGATEKMTLSFRLPYDVKDQHVRYTTLDGEPYVPPYGDIHHRTETLRGIGDAQLGALFPLGGRFFGGTVQVGAGISIPLGHTVENPIVLGREGKTHEHIQFGTGTVDPLLSLLWTLPVPDAGGLAVTAAADAQIPLYENSHGFRAPISIRYAVGPNLPFGSTGVALQFAGQYQSIGKWDGEQDEGTGFHNGGVFLRASFLPWKGWRVSPAVYREVYSKSLSDESFKQGTTYSLTVTRFF